MKNILSNEKECMRNEKSSNAKSMWNLMTNVWMVSSSVTEKVFVLTFLRKYNSIKLLNKQKFSENTELFRTEKPQLAKNNKLYDHHQTEFRDL